MSPAAHPPAALSPLPPVAVQPLTAEAFAPYGWVLGKPYADGDPRVGFRHPGSDFWHEHAFDTGGGETEVLWVDYRNDSRLVRALEAHLLTQQAIVPLGGAAILHAVALCRPGEDLPDLATLKVFEVGGSRGICMKPRVWHASLVRGGQTTCLMLTRRSTTADLVGHLSGGMPMMETAIVTLESLGREPVRILAE